ncbi:hypothetical protein KFE25_007098 [Diacronema lutheri]|uniref:LOV domain-containing protein n=1 Tax=Diacronema lutheri TaxID=2081491 RepID=A0A8J5XSA2_DIALT|nr:hypothetical protein KFE25_007098 [Diacronema lutheri]
MLPQVGEEGGEDWDSGGEQQSGARFAAGPQSPAPYPPQPTAPMAQTFPLPTGPAPPAPVRRPAQVRPRSVSPRRSASPRNRRYPSSPRRAASASKYWWRQYGDSPSGGDMAPYLMDMLAAKEDEAADWRMMMSDHMDRLEQTLAQLAQPQQPQMIRTPGAVPIERTPAGLDDRQLERIEDRMYSVVNKVLERAGSPRSHATNDLDALEERLLRRLDRQTPPPAAAASSSDMERRLEARLERVMQMVSDLQSQNLARSAQPPVLPMMAPQSGGGGMDAGAMQMMQAMMQQQQQAMEQRMAQQAAMMEKVLSSAAAAPKPADDGGMMRQMQEMMAKRERDDREREDQRRREEQERADEMRKMRIEQEEEARKMRDEMMRAQADAARKMDEAKHAAELERMESERKRELERMEMTKKMEEEKMQLERQRMEEQRKLERERMDAEKKRAEELAALERQRMDEMRKMEDARREEAKQAEEARRKEKQELEERLAAEKKEQEEERRRQQEAQKAEAAAAQRALEQRLAAAEAEAKAQAEAAKAEAEAAKAQALKATADATAAAAKEAADAKAQLEQAKADAAKAATDAADAAAKAAAKAAAGDADAKAEQARAEQAQAAAAKAAASAAETEAKAATASAQPAAAAAAAAAQPAASAGAFDFALPEKTVKILKQLQAAGEGKGAMPTDGDGTWLGALKAAVDELPIAVAITDMKVPGVTVQYCNGGFLRVTGYPKAETEGRNCRFLQGKETEPKMVTKMVRALRYAKELALDVTNYRLDGSKFTNDLSLTPVHDTEGEYRYSLGILSWKEQQTPDETKALAQLRELLPRKMAASAQPKVFEQGAVKVDANAKQKQFQASMVKFTKLLWTIDTEASLDKLMEVPEAREAFHAFLQKTYEHTQLDFWAEAKKLAYMKGKERDKYARDICVKYLGIDKAAAKDMDHASVEAKAAEFYKVLANDSFPKFVKSKQCDPVVEAMLGENNRLDASKDLIWKKYKVPADMEGFVYSFVAVAETFPACIVISDMSIPGNPMFFINQEFSKITGYSKSDAQGRNCRFLQGPKTEPASVAVIQDTLRRGVDCYVRITNYRKNGETFQNLLSMRPVHDSNGVYRFCIGVQFEVDSGTDLKKRLKKLGLLLQLLPSEIEVMHTDAKVGPKHVKKLTDSEKGRTEDEFIATAMEKVADVADAGDMQGEERYADHHQTMLDEIGSISATADVAADFAIPSETISILEKLQAVGEGKGSMPSAGGGTWLGAMKAALENLPIAVSICDMKVPGVTITWTNGGMERVTGYAKEEVEGVNLRMLQGPTTESKVVTKMVRALRYAKELAVEVKNYRKDGSRFTNDLTLTPVHDTDGEYRYVIGILSYKEKQSAEEKAALAKIRALLPRKMPASAQPKTFEQEAVKVDDDDKAKQFRASMVKFTKLLWTLDTEASLDKLMEVPEAYQAFHKFLEKTYEHTQLDFWADARKLSYMQGSQQDDQARLICTKFLGMTAADAASMDAKSVEAKAAEFYKVLSNDSFTRFVKSKQCDPVVDAMLGQNTRVEGARDLIWKKYKVPADMEGFVYSFVAVAETFPACIVISDMSIPGNPMFFINQEFSKITGYSKSDAQGRNCRFLQGPKTEPASVAVIQDTLRRGVDCYVRITNYRKNGETFQNLLSMRPVHDSNGVYRFCIGVQFEVDGGTDLKKRLKKLGLLLQLLPSEIEVMHKNDKVGPKHHKKQTAADAGKNEDQLIAQAMKKVADATEASDMKDEERYADHHQTMLDEIGGVGLDASAAPSDFRLSSNTTSIFEALQKAGEGKGAVPKHGDGTWLDAIKAACETIPIGVAITDMKVPGVTVGWCNKGFERVTGYPKEETEGVNCRFLQGANTEPVVVTKMVRALRYAKELTVDVTNYRKDGKKFTNDLSLTPVHDTTGEYRYSIGILSWKEQQTPEEKAALEKIRALLPRKMPADAQPTEFDQTAVKVDSTQKQAQFRASMVKFTKLLWTLDTEASLEKLMEVPDAYEAFHKFLEKTYEHTQLDFWAEARKLEYMESGEEDKHARETCVKFLGMTAADTSSMDAKSVKAKAAEFYKVLSNDSFPRFVKSKQCDPVVDALLGEHDRIDASKELVWHKYKVPADMEGFVYSFVAVAETFPACIVISDMSIPGNPMFFVNQEFSKITGYSKTDAQGRNCRFLQGPKTEPASVAVIQDTLRRGVDCYVRITNYRKNGQTFQNLLSMRPVHDSNGVYRFCIGVQFEVDADMDLKKRLKKLGLLLQLLPSEIEVMHKNDKVGPKHLKKKTAADVGKNEDQLIAQAMTKVADVADASDMQGGARYADHHQTMLEEIGGVGIEAAMEAADYKLPPTAVSILKELQKAGEGKGAVPKHGGGTWLDAIKAAVEGIPIGVAITDMKVPGVNVLWCNKGFARVTGFTKEETEGRNCRFLQGGNTEPVVVTKMVRALRYAKELTVDVTNYRKDGTSFVNDLSLTPVHDSNGEYRYSLGILSWKEKQTDVEKKSLAQLRELLPRKMPADAQPKEFVGDDIKVDDSDKKKQFRASMVKFTKLLWTLDTEASLEKLMEVSTAREAFHKFLKKSYEHTQLDFWAEAKRVHGDDVAARELCVKYLGMTEADAASYSATAVEKKAREFYKVLCNDSFPKFVKSKYCDPVVDAMLGDTSKTDGGKDLIWEKYKVPADMEGFVYSFVAVAETFPACIVISDMSIPGNPMFFINQEFSKITGYSKKDAQGRNCRFLQGPKTEPASVAVIQDTLRRGVDCYVRITNYRKNGETFQNLLSMRPVHDSNGVYRFCIGVQFEVDSGTDLKKRLKKLGLLLQLLPSEIEVMHKNDKVGPKHLKKKTAADAGKNEDQLIKQALEVTASAGDAADMQGGARFADHHQTMLEEIGAVAEVTVAAVDAKAWKLPDKTTKILKELQKAGEGKGAIPKEGDGTWLSALKAAVEGIPHAVVITDMKVPGVNLMWVSDAFERVTGYSKSDAEGRNCRFLQGGGTEPNIVTKMVRALRYAKELTVDVTNYRKEGPSFTCDLSLTPVHDSNGEYRYSIGVQSWKEKQTPDETKALAQLRELLPRKMPADAQPKVFEQEAVKVDASDKKKQFKASMVKFTKLLWTIDTEASLDKLMEVSSAKEAFHAFLQKTYEHTQLDFWLESRAVDGDGEAAAKLCTKYLGMSESEAKAMSADAVEAKAAEFYKVLANDSFPKFVKSKQCDPVVEAMLGNSDSLDAHKKLIWDKYKVPEDMEGFVYSFVAVAETFPACIVISDMSIPGNPMFFINQEFTRITGYRKREAQGRNCRFLQGPKTEPASVAVIQDTLRRGVDCYVRITNYRKNGETFQNLLSMRPVHDSNGVYRFCIGVQFEVDGGTDLKKRLKKLGLLLQLLPSEIEVMHKNDKVGPKHKKELKSSEQGKSEDQFLAQAMEKVADASDAADMQGSDRFADHHDTMLEEIGAMVSADTEMDKKAWKLPDKTTKILKELQKAGEGKGAIPKEGDGTWLSALKAAVEGIPHAVVITDMKVPGVNLMWVNGGFQRVTGYPKDEAEGRNCRFLQGKETEPNIVTKMVRALRYAKELTVDVTNYRAEGLKFTCDLSLTPVHDSNGEYRYSIGVQSWKEKQTPDETKALAQLRELLPRKMPADAQPKEFVGDEVKVDDSDKTKQFQASMVKFTKLLWTIDTEASLEKLMDTTQAKDAFHKFLKKSYEHMQLDFWRESKSVAGNNDVARELCTKYLGMTAADAASMDAEAVEKKAREFYMVLANDSFPRFVKSKYCDPVVEAMLGSDSRMDGSKGLIWSKYKVPADMEGFVYSFVAVAETFPACIVISDMSIPGNPMFFINQEFSKITGYSKSDAQGRNCRFLQGPLTEPASVAVIQDTLRRGVDCYVRITNYRKNGETFQNLLSMRPVHDSNGVYRFCIGVQFEVDAATDLKKRLKKLGLLLQLLPSEIQVMHKNDKVGPKHKKELKSSEKGKNEEQFIQDAMEKVADASDAADMQGSDRYADHHQTMLEELGGGAVSAMDVESVAAPAKKKGFFGR